MASHVPSWGRSIYSIKAVRRVGYAPRALSDLSTTDLKMVRIANPTADSKQSSNFARTANTGTSHVVGKLLFR